MALRGGESSYEDLSMSVDVPFCLIDLGRVCWLNDYCLSE